MVGTGVEWVGTSAERAPLWSRNRGRDTIPSAFRRRSASPITQGVGASRQDGDQVRPKEVDKISGAGSGQVGPRG